LLITYYRWEIRKGLVRKGVARAVWKSWNLDQVGDGKEGMVCCRVSVLVGMQKEGQATEVENKKSSQGLQSIPIMVEKEDSQVVDKFMLIRVDLSMYCM